MFPLSEGPPLFEAVDDIGQRARAFTQQDDEIIRSINYINKFSYSTDLNMKTTVDSNQLSAV